MGKKIMKKIAKEILPPFIHEALRKLFYRDKYKYNPTWHTIKGGILKGRQIFIDPADGLWQKDMLEGRYDKFLFDYLKNLNMKGKIVFEIGAHIGFHAMTFAELVGDEGKVYAFEPNIYNQERMTIILSRNPDLAKRIETLNVAVSNDAGETEFFFTSDVDRGMSSGSFIPESHAFYQNSKQYVQVYQMTRVKTVSIDGMQEYLGKSVVPYLIKIDVEDAESSVLKGAMNLLKATPPYILIEVHSIYSMFKTNEVLNETGYRIKLLKEEPDGRCFFAAEPSRRM